MIERIAQRDVRPPRHILQQEPALRFRIRQDIKGGDGRIHARKITQTLQERPAERWMAWSCGAPWRIVMNPANCAADLKIDRGGEGHVETGARCASFC